MVGLEGQEEFLRRGSTVDVAVVPRYTTGVAFFFAVGASGLLDEEDERRAAPCCRRGVSMPVSKLKSLEMLGKGLEGFFVHFALPGGVLEEVGVHLEDELSVDVLPLLMLLFAHAAAAAAAHPRAARSENDTR